MTTEPSFTPGPWHIAEPYGPEDLDIGAGNWMWGETIVNADKPITAVWIGRGWQLKDGEAEANAHLIAAAPELYEALAKMATVTSVTCVSLYDEEGVEGWRWTFTDGSECTELGAWHDDPPLPAFVADALAKARGEVSV